MDSARRRTGTKKSPRKDKLKKSTKRARSTTRVGSSSSISSKHHQQSSHITTNYNPSALDLSRQPSLAPKDNTRSQSSTVITPFFDIRPLDLGPLDEERKQEFNKYLEESGFKQYILRAIVTLYEEKEKPDDVFQWLIIFAGANLHDDEDLESHREEAKSLYERIKRLQTENQDLRQELERRITHATTTGNGGEISSELSAEYEWLQWKGLVDTSEYVYLDQLHCSPKNCLAADGNVLHGSGKKASDNASISSAGVELGRYPHHVLPA